MLIKQQTKGNIVNRKVSYNVPWCNDNAKQFQNYINLRWYFYTDFRSVATIVRHLTSPVNPVVAYYITLPI